MSAAIFPKMVLIKQHFERSRIEDIAGTVRAELDKLKSSIPAGKTVGLTAGSRGIQNILTILETAIDYIK